MVSVELHTHANVRRGITPVDGSRWIIVQRLLWVPPLVLGSQGHRQVFRRGMPITAAFVAIEELNCRARLRFCLKT